MSEPDTSRPRQVTLAAGLIMGGSLFVVISVFEQMAGISSLRTREAVEEFLGDPPAAGMGLGVEGVLDLLRVVAMVAGACATATGILGFQVLHRSRVARVVLTVLAVPLFLSGLVAGGFMSSLVAVAIVMLWLQPARDWFAGIDRPVPRPASESATERSSTPVWPPAQPPVQEPAQPQTQPQPQAQPQGEYPLQQPGAGPRPWTGFGSQSAPVAPYAGPPQPGPPAYAPAQRRPLAVLWACILTWVGAGLAGVSLLFTSLVLAAAPDPLFDEMRRQQPDLLESAGMSQDELADAVLAVAAIGFVWCAIAVVLAILAFRRSGWARVALIVSAALAGITCLVGTLAGSFLLVVPFAACTASIAMLSRPESRAWFARRGSISS